MSSPKDIIKERLTIEDCISSYVELLPSGKNFKARCPFHNEKTPSFFVSPDRDSFYCFGCGAGGDVFTFVEKFEGVDFRGALKILADRTGVKLEENTNLQKDEKETLYLIMDKATEYFESEFEKNNLARMYLHERGLIDETIKDFRIGFAPASWRSVSDFLFKSGFKESDLLKVGLIKKSEKDNKSFYDRFRSRIMFPITDSSGRVIAFSGRIFGEQDKDFKQAKYINSTDSVLFNKSSTLFGIDKAKLNIRKKGYTILVEGQLDLVMSHQIGLDNTVAVSGTALASSADNDNSSINNLGLIRRLSPNIILAFDGDEAGLRATRRSAMIAFSLDMQVKVANNLDGRDPADIMKENKDEWKDIIRNSKHIISFEIDHMIAKSRDSKAWSRSIREVIFPYIHTIKSRIEQTNYIKEIHDKTGIREDAIYSDFESYQKANLLPEEKIDNQKDQIPRQSLLEKQFFSIIFYLEDSAENNEKAKEATRILINKIGDSSFKEMRDKYESFKDALVLEAQMWYGSEIEPTVRDLEEVILNLEEEMLKTQSKDVFTEIHKAERDKDKGRLQRLLKDYQELINKIQNIKNNRK